jgi:hypothetical protein
MGYLIVGAMARFEEHFTGVGWRVAGKAGAAASGIHPRIMQAPQKQQGCSEVGEERIERLAPRDVKHRAKHPEGARIPRRSQDRLHQGVIHDVLRPLQSGKEAEVYLVEVDSGVCVAKVYKHAHQRSFKNRADLAVLV